MKKSVLFFVAILFVGICNAQTTKPKLYTFAFADTDVADIGKGELKNLTNFHNFMDVIGAQLGEYIQYQGVEEISGYQCTKESLEAWVADFSCASNDVVMFVYMGHGSHSMGDTSTQFPQMRLGTTDADYVNLEWVKNQLVKKNPKLCIVIGDCCNSYNENRTVKALTPKYSDKDATLVSCASDNPHVQALKMLFCDSQGSVIASGSKPGELSWIDTDPKNESQAGMFMDAFIRAVGAATTTSSNENLWDVVFKQVQQDPTLRAILGNDGQMHMQHPIYKINSERLAEPRKDSVISVINDVPLNQALLSIGDDRIDDQQRAENVNLVLQKYFAKDALVYFVSERGRRLETKYVKDYLEELSGKALFRGAVIRSIKKDSQGKITSLSIHEIYEEKVAFDKF